MPSPTRPLPAYVAVACAAVCVFMNLYSPQAVLPLIAADFGASPAAASLTMTANALAIAGVAPFAGAIADVLGRKRVIAAAMLAVTVPTVLMGFAPDLPSLVAIRFVQGLLLPPIFTVLVAYIGEEWPRGEATSMTGVYIAACSFGGFLGRALTGAVADLSTWRTAFLVDGLITLALAVAVATLLPREQRFVRARHVGAAFAQMLKHFANPQLVATYALGFGVLFNFLAAFTYVTFYLAGPPFRLSPALIGAVFVVYLFGTAASPWTGRAVARFGRKPFMLAILALWAAGIAVTLVAWLPAVVAGMALFAVGGFVCQALSTSYVALSAREGVSSAVGLYVTFYYIGGSVGTLAGGAAWHVDGWAALVALVVAMLAIMAGIVAAVWPREA